MILIIVLLLVISSVAVAVILYRKKAVEAAETSIQVKTNGRIVRFEQDKGCINIAWIKVYAIVEGLEILVSQGRPTSASSVYKDVPALFGEKNIHLYDEYVNSYKGDMVNGYHSYCNKDNELEWIEINLENDYNITRIELKNREDDKKERVLEGKLSILDKDMYETWSQVITETQDQYSYTIGEASVEGFGFRGRQGRERNFDGR
jgi:hypothetical protein